MQVTGRALRCAVRRCLPSIEPACGWMLLLGLALHTVGCLEPDSESQAVAGSTQRLRVGPPLPETEGEDPEGEEAFEIEDRRRLGYVYPRDYPSSEVSLSRRALALEQLAVMRTALAQPHFDPDAPPAPPDTCGGSCDEDQACLFGACRDQCGGGEFPCNFLCPFQTEGDCFCVPCGGPGDDAGGGPGGPGAPGCGWFPTGPTNIPGRVMALAVDPGDGNRLFAGTVGGLWGSADKGRRWERVRVGAASRVVSDIGFNAGTREMFLAMSDFAYESRGDGVWMSPSGESDSFIKVSDATVDSLRVSRVISAAGVDGDVYLATTGGLYLGTRSAGAFSWARLDAMDAPVDDMEITFSTTPPTVYAGVRAGSATFAAGIWKHDANGWVKSDGGITLGATRRISLTLVTNTPQTLYAKVATAANAFEVYKTSDGAATNWTQLASASSTVIGEGFAWYNTLLQADPNDPNTVYLGTVGLWSTTDGGTTWTDISGGTDASFPHTIHADQHSMTFDPSNSKIVYAGNDGGVYRSTDRSAAAFRWNTRAHGMATTEFYRLTSQLASAGLIAGGSQDNGTEITFGNQTWYMPGGCDGSDVAVDAANASTLYAHCNGNLFEIINPVPYTPGGGSAVCSLNSMGTCDCAACWTFPAGVTAQTTGIGVPVLVAADPTVARTALLRGVSTTSTQQVVLKTTDGLSWSTILTPAGTNVTAFAIAATASDPKLYYVGATDAMGAGVVYVSSDSGANWTSSALPAGVARANSITIDPVTPTRAWVATSGAGQIAQTTDGGGTWTALTAVDAAHTMPAAAAVTAVVVDASNNRLFAGTDIGVFVGVLSGANSVSWEPYDDGLPSGTDVNDIYLNAQTSSLFIGTWGLGSFRRSIAETECPSVELLVRDSLFDTGQDPTPTALPDPEHPVADTANPPFYKPDDSEGGLVYFWESTDIRIDVPSLYSDCYQFSDVDHVEFESCPRRSPAAPPGS